MKHEKEERSVLLAQPSVQVILLSFSYRIMKSFQEKEGNYKDEETGLPGVCPPDLSKKILGTAAAGSVSSLTSSYFLFLPISVV